MTKAPLLSYDLERKVIEVDRDIQACRATCSDTPKLRLIAQEWLTSLVKRRQALLSLFVKAAKRESVSEGHVPWVGLDMRD